MHCILSHLITLRGYGAKHQDFKVCKLVVVRLEQGSFGGVTKPELS